MSKSPIQQELISGLDLSAMLGRFCISDQEYSIIKLSEKADNVFYNSDLWQEICRFEVNGCDCMVVMKIPQLENQQSNLTVILTARELQIATLVASGCPNKQVADKLHISEWTVATYLRRIFAKLGVDTRAAMTYRCASLIYNQNIALSK